MVRSSSGCWCNDLCMRTFAPDAIASLRFFGGSLGAERHDKRCCDKQAACHATKLGGRSMKHVWWWLVMSIASVIFSVSFSILFVFGCTNNVFFGGLFRWYVSLEGRWFLWPEDRSFTFATPGAKRFGDAPVHREWRVAYTSKVGWNNSLIVFRETAICNFITRSCSFAVWKVWNEAWLWRPCPSARAELPIATRQNRECGTGNDQQTSLIHHERLRTFIAFSILCYILLSIAMSDASCFEHQICWNSGCYKHCQDLSQESLSHKRSECTAAKWDLNRLDRCNLVQLSAISFNNSILVQDLAVSGRHEPQMSQNLDLLFLKSGDKGLSGMEVLQRENFLRKYVSWT